MMLLKFLAELASALSRIVDYFQKKEERAREVVPSPQKPTTVEEYERHRRAAKPTDKPN